MNGTVGSAHPGGSDEFDGDCPLPAMYPGLAYAEKMRTPITMSATTTTTMMMVVLYTFCILGWAQVLPIDATVKVIPAPRGRHLGVPVSLKVNLLQL